MGEMLGQRGRSFLTKKNGAGGWGVRVLKGRYKDLEKGLGSKRLFCTV